MFPILEADCNPCSQSFAPFLIASSITFKFSDWTAKYKILFHLQFTILKKKKKKKKNK